MEGISRCQNKASGSLFFLKGQVFVMTAPDDAEVQMGGAMAKLIDQGRRIFLINCFLGSSEKKAEEYMVPQGLPRPSGASTAEER